MLTRWLFVALGLIGAFDTLYFHEWRGRLTSRGGSIRFELGLHAARDFIYVIVFGTLAWFEWRGHLAVIFGLLMATEVLITLADFVVEDRVRQPLGGVYPGERIAHTVMAIVYGAILASFLPVLADWSRSRTEFVWSTGVPAGLRIALSLFALGIAVSGVRDLLGAVGSRTGHWPWHIDWLTAEPSVMHGEVLNERRHRRIFLAAGVYNISWGAFSMIYPQWLFEFADMAPSNRPQIFATLGMVIGLYGILYLEVARNPARGWLIAAVGLCGKVLGPVGMTYLLLTGTWPLRSVIICITNDVIWWIPFARYLIDTWPAFRRDVISVEHRPTSPSRSTS